MQELDLTNALKNSVSPNGIAQGIFGNADRIDEESWRDLIMFSQYMTAYAGELYNINAFDQPGVEYGKKLTFAMMNRAGFEQYNEKIRSIRQRERSIVR